MLSMKTYRKLISILRENNCSKSYSVYLFYFVCAVLFVVFFSYSTSFEYPFYFGGDSAQFLTVGKCWYLGKIPYSEVFDHKGPFIFWIDMVGYILGSGSENAIVFIQVIFLFFSICGWNKLSRFVSDSKSYCVFAIIISLIVMKRNYVDGNSVEEYCIPFITWSLVGFFMQEQELKKFNKISYRWTFLYGVTFGICLLTRVSNFLPLVVFLFMIIIDLLIIRNYKELVKNLLIGISGMLAILLPFVIYFALKGALSDMIYGTLTFNIEYKRARPSGVIGMTANTFRDFLLNYFLVYTLLFAGILCFIRREYRYFILYSMTSVLELFFFTSGDLFVQYPMVCMPQLIVLLNELTIFYNWGVEQKKFEDILVWSGIVIVIFYNIGNCFQYNMLYSFDYYKSYNSPKKYEWTSLIEEIPLSDLSSFVAYGGNEFKEIYLLENIIPKYKYFVIQEWHASISSEAKNNIHRVFDEGDAKWILTDSNVQNISNILDRDYHLVDSVDVYKLYEHN